MIPIQDSEVTSSIVCRVSFPALLTRTSIRSKRRPTPPAMAEWTAPTSVRLQGRKTGGTRPVSRRRSDEPGRRLLLDVEEDDARRLAGEVLHKSFADAFCPAGDDNHAFAKAGVSGKVGGAGSTGMLAGPPCLTE